MFSLAFVLGLPTGAMVVHGVIERHFGLVVSGIAWFFFSQSFLMLAKG